jgi:hypothetical protein
MFSEGAELKHFLLCPDTFMCVCLTKQGGVFNCVVYRNYHFCLLCQMGGKLGSLALGKDKKLRLFENWVLTEVFGPKGKR